MHSPAVIIVSRKVISNDVHKLLLQQEFNNIDFLLLILQAP